MRKTIYLFFLMAVLSLHAQDVLWEKSYGGKHADFLLDAQPTADYGYILAGSSFSVKSGNKTEDNQGDLDYWLWKMDETGGLDWQKSFGGPGMDMLYSIRNTSDGGFILAGSSNSPKGLYKKEDSHGQEDIWIIKLDAKGNEMWQKTIGGSGRDVIKTIAPTTDGGYIIGGSSASAMSPIVAKGGSDPYNKKEACRGNLDYWIIKIDSQGTVKWQRTLGGQYADILESIEPTKDGGYIVGGYSNSPTSQDKGHEGYGEGDYWILKLDKEGVIEWQQVLGGEEDDHLSSIIQTNDGRYIAAGNSASSTSGNKSKPNRKGTDYWIVKLDEKGQILWQETYNIGNRDVLTSIIENKDGTILLGGYAQSEEIGSHKKDKAAINDYVAIKITPEGEEKWRQAVGSHGDDILRKLVETRDGGYLLAGTSNGEISGERNSGNGGNDFWVVKLKDKEKKDVAAKKPIEAVPNPAKQFTNIIIGFEFTSGTASVFDISGRQLQSFAIATRTVPVDLGSYPEGIYLVEVKTDTGSNSVKVMKTRN